MMNRSTKDFLDGIHILEQARAVVYERFTGAWVKWIYTVNSCQLSQSQIERSRVESVNRKSEPEVKLIWRNRVWCENCSSAPIIQSLSLKFLFPKKAPRQREYPLFVSSFRQNWLCQRASSSSLAFEPIRASLPHGHRLSSDEVKMFSSISLWYISHRNPSKTPIWQLLYDQCNPITIDIISDVIVACYATDLTWDLYLLSCKSSFVLLGSRQT